MTEPSVGTAESPLRVLFVTGSFPPMRCGVGDYTARLAAALARRADVRVAVLTDAAGTDVRQNVELFPVVRNWSAGDVMRVFRVLRAWHPDVVHIQYPTQGYGSRRMPWLLPLMLKLARRRVVQTWHEYMPMGTWRNSLPIVCVADAVVVVRPDYERRLPGVVARRLRQRIFEMIPNASVVPVARLTEAERADIRARYLRGSAKDLKLVATFGFAYAPKGFDLLFRIADPRRHFLLFCTELDPGQPYPARLRRSMEEGRWRGRAAATGFLSAPEAARALAAADAAVFPFVDGGGPWNSSIHAAATQGTFVVTTSPDRRGYDAGRHIYYAAPGDVEDMQRALDRYGGERHRAAGGEADDAWSAIAERHARLYRKFLGAGGTA